MNALPRRHRLASGPLKQLPASLFAAALLVAAAHPCAAAKLSFRHLDGAVVLPSGELVLESSPAGMIFAFRATEWKRVTALAVFMDKLYIGACEEPSVHESGDVLVYDGGAGEVKKIYTVREQGLTRMRAFGGRLYVAGADSTTDDISGNVYIFDGVEWSKKTFGNEKKVAHVWDLAALGGKLYVSTSTRTRYGVLWESGDGGDTWKPVYEYTQPGAGFPIYLEDLAVYGGRLYSWLEDHAHGAVDAGLVEFDGKEGREIFPFEDADTRVTLSSFGLAGDELYVCGDFGPFYVSPAQKPFFFSISPSYRGRKRSGRPPEPGCCAFDGAGCAPVPFFKNKRVDTFGAFNGTPVAAVYDGGRERSFLAVREGNEWKETAALPPGVRGLALAQYRGRLFLGTMPDGGVYVSPFGNEGSAVLDAFPLQPGEKCRLSVDAVLPESTRLEIRSRGAETRELLEREPFKETGDAATPELYESFENNSAAGLWIQLEVVLKSDDPLFSPVVRAVSCDRPEEHFRNQQ